MHTNFIKLNFMQLVMNSQTRFIQMLVGFPSDQPVLTSSAVPIHKVTMFTQKISSPSLVPGTVCIICLLHISPLLTKLIMNFCHHFLFWLNLTLGIHSFCPRVVVVRNSQASEFRKAVAPFSSHGPSYFNMHNPGSGAAPPPL